MVARFHCVMTDGPRDKYEQLRVFGGDIMHKKRRVAQDKGQV